MFLFSQLDQKIVKTLSDQQSVLTSPETIRVVITYLGVTTTIFIVIAVTFGILRRIYNKKMSRRVEEAKEVQCNIPVFMIYQKRSLLSFSLGKGHTLRLPAAV